MGIGVPKEANSLSSLIHQRPSFQTHSKYCFNTCLCVWKVEENKSTTYLPFPYEFYTDENYICLIISPSNSRASLDRQRIPIEFNQVFFTLQFLRECYHMEKFIEISDIPYHIECFALWGDAQNLQLQSRLKLIQIVKAISDNFEIIGKCMILELMNSSVMIPIPEKLNEYINFDPDHFPELFDNNRVIKKLFGEKSTLKNLIRGIPKCHQVISLVETAVKKEQKKEAQVQVVKEQVMDLSQPFNCQITQINTKGKKIVEPDESNLLLDEFQHHSQKNIPKVKEIVPQLYIGTEACSRNYKTIAENKIKLIINLAPDKCKNWFLNDFDYQWIFMRDPIEKTQIQGDIDIECLVYGVTDIVQRYLKSDDKVGIMIHCAGYDPDIVESGTRSVSLMIGILIAYFGIGYDEAYNLVDKKWKKTVLDAKIQKQLRFIAQRIKQKTDFKGFKLYGMSSYSWDAPDHIVAKYIRDIESISHIQGIDGYAQGTFIAVNHKSAKILFGRECKQQDIYIQKAKKHINLLYKYENTPEPLTISIQPLDKTFRKQPPLSVPLGTLLRIPNSRSKNPGYRSNQIMTLKYPLLRPVWEKKSDEGFYFTIKEKDGGAYVGMNKGINWIGFQEDKREFFDRVISCYLKHLPDEKIWITEEDAEESLFDISAIQF